PGPFDTAGFLLAGGGLGLLMYGVSEGPIRHWSSAAVRGTIAGGVLLLAVLVLAELRKSRPLIDLRLLGNRLFRSANSVLILSSASFIGTLYVVSLFFQDGRHLTALGSGLSTFPEAIGVMGGAQLASRVLYVRLGPRRNIAVGMLGVATTIALMSLIGAQTNLWWMRLLMFSLGVAIGQVFVPSQAAAFAGISPEATGRASTLFNVTRQLGSAVGVAVFTTVIVAVGATKVAAGRVTPDFTAYHMAFLVAAALAVAGAGLALTIHDADAAATMVRRRGRAPAPDPSAAAKTAGQVRPERPPG
ncbi:MAG: MFS transporter, partial [Actinomycetota bacterium]